MKKIIFIGMAIVILGMIILGGIDKHEQESAVEVDLVEAYLEEHEWLECHGYSYELEDSVVTDEYFFIKIYNNEGKLKCVDTIYR